MLSTSSQSPSSVLYISCIMLPASSMAVAATSNPARLSGKHPPGSSAYGRLSAGSRRIPKHWRTASVVVVGWRHLRRGRVQPPRLLSWRKVRGPPQIIRRQSYGNSVMAREARERCAAVGGRRSLRLRMVTRITLHCF